MPTISSYALQYSDVNFAAISSSTFDLFITEGAPLAPGGGFPRDHRREVAQLKAQGRTVVGYVNVAVTDDARYYWNPGWTSNGQDTGTPYGEAPSWLARRVPSTSTASPGQDALIVEFRDAGLAAHRHRPGRRAGRRGYAGVFLDDVGRYYTLGAGSGTIPLMANLMLEFVPEIRAGDHRGQSRRHRGHQHRSLHRHRQPGRPLQHARGGLSRRRRHPSHRKSGRLRRSTISPPISAASRC